jgi:Uma2 family endonuclease
LDERHRGIVINPLLIVEVLSPSTERDDVFIKLPAYRRIAGLQEILYVESERVGATVYRRTGNRWQETLLSALDDRLQLHSVRIDVELGRLYRGIPGMAP